MSSHSKWQRPTSLVLGATLLLAAGAHTQSTTATTTTNGETVPATTAAAAPTAGGAAGVRAFIDPATGELTANPSPEQLQRMALVPRAALSRSMAGLQPFALDRGGRGVNLQGRFQSALRVQRGDDGTYRVICGDPAHDRTSHSHDGAATTGEAAVTPPASDRPVQ
jgi:hypothetical protein